MSSGAIRSSRVSAGGRVGPACVVFEAGRVRRIAGYRELPAAEVVDVGDRVVFPGLVDTHVHVNEPGRTEWEGFETATRAAAAGGVTTLVDMPLNSVPATVSPAALDAKVEATEGKLHVDVGFWGGLVPASCERLEELAAAGVLGFKAFLVDSGVEDFPPVGRAELLAALPALAASGLPLLVHAELPGPIERAAAGLAGDRRAYATYLRSRPPEAEVEAVELLLELCRQRPFRLHVVHVATERVLPLLAEARREGLAVSAETCPHYLSFAAEEVADGATVFKCAPPIRGGDTRERLWAALGEGELDLVASDHSPAPAALKRLESGDFFDAWGGIASLQLLLAAVWTGARRRGFDLGALEAWLCRRPARLAGLEGRKGSLQPGGDADLVVWDPEASFVVEAEHLEHRHPLTPYAGRRLFGVVEATWLRGEQVYERGAASGGPRGRRLLRAEGGPRPGGASA